jgi:hypothetical protein
VNALWDELVVIAGKEENMLLDVETMLNLDLYDERPCRFVPEFHCRGKMYSISMLLLNSVAIVSIFFQIGGREEYMVFSIIWIGFRQ